MRFGTQGSTSPTCTSTNPSEVQEHVNPTLSLLRLNPKPIPPHSRPRLSGLRRATAPDKELPRALGPQLRLEGLGFRVAGLGIWGFGVLGVGFLCFAVSGRVTLKGIASFKGWPRVWTPNLKLGAPPLSERCTASIQILTET